MKIAKLEMDNGVTFAIRDDQLPLTIGRSKTCDIRINEPTVSRLHCELYLDTMRDLCVKDLSSNGTTVDREYLYGSSAKIQHYSQVRFAGDRGLVVKLTDDDGQTLVPRH